MNRPEPSTGHPRFKSWRTVRNEVVAAIRAFTDDPLAHGVFPSAIHMEGYPGPGTTTGTFKATWRGNRPLEFRVRIALERDSVRRAEVL